MNRTATFAKGIGYTDDQAELIGKMSDLVEEAVNLDMCTSIEAKTIEVYLAQIFGRHTGKLNLQGITYAERGL